MRPLMIWWFLFSFISDYVRSTEDQSEQHFNEAGQPCTSEKVVIDRLFENYVKHKLPVPDGVKVAVDIWVQEITSVSEITSDFEIDIYINELWFDPALKFSHFSPCKTTLALTHEKFEQLWTPNSCFINSKSASIHNSPFRNIFLMIYDNGTLWANYRVKVKGPCDMDLAKFPMDTQVCTLIYESFNYNNKEVDMRWRAFDPVTRLKNFSLPDFELIDIKTADYPKLYPAGDWNELEVTFVFKRRYVWYILQAYIPTYLTIFISWISFTLGSKAIPARTMLGVNSLLAMIMMFGNIMRNLPRVSYVKAIDVWMLCCMSFNFASLVELAIVGHLTKDGKGEGVNSAPSCRSRSRRKSGLHKSGAESSVSPKMCKFVHQQAQDPSSPITRYVLDDEPAGFGAGFVGTSSNGDPQVAPCVSAYPTVASSTPRFYPSVRPTNGWDEAPARRSRKQTFAPLFCCYRCGRRAALYCRDALDCRTTGRRRTSATGAADDDDVDGDDPDGGFGRTFPAAAAKSTVASRKLTADFIDQASCFLFPALFSFFNVCYWAIYSSEWKTDKK